VFEKEREKEALTGTCAHFSYLDMYTVVMELLQRHGTMRQFETGIEE
jgi:hypothetical protein